MVRTKTEPLTAPKTWENVTGHDVSEIILKRMDELEDLPATEYRKDELKGHEDELQIIAQRITALNAELTIGAKVPPTYFFLTVSDSKVEAQYEEQGEQVNREIRDLLDYHDFFAARVRAARAQGLTISVMASSSMDFPHEYSKEQAVIDLATAIRTNEEAA